MSDQKKTIALHIAEMLQSYSAIGFGSGTTVASIISVSQHLKGNERHFFSASSMSSIEMQKHQIPETSFLAMQELDVCVDGVDQTVSSKNPMIIKGGGGALLREKIMWNSAKHIIVGATPEKIVDHFSFPIPVEIVPYGFNLSLKWLNELVSIYFEEARLKLRLTPQGIPFQSDNSNWIIDINYSKVIGDLTEFHEKAIQCPAIIETGLFFGFRNMVLVTVDEKNKIETMQL